MKTKPNTKKGEEVEFTSSFFPGQNFLVKPKNIHPVPRCLKGLNLIKQI